VSEFNVTDPIFEWAARAPEAVAILEGGHATTYAELCDAVERTAQHFRHAGLAPGDRVGIALPREDAMHLCVGLALARIGATQVSLHPGEAALRRRARAGTLGIRAVVGSAQGLGDLLEVAPQPGEGASTENGEARAPGGRRDWIIAQSSGTTAAPKNIAISHRAEQVRGERLKPMFAMRPGERYLNLTTLRFQVGMAWALRCLSDGAAFVFASARADVDEVLALIDRHEVGFFACTPRHLQQILQGLAPGDAPRLPGLRVLRCSTALLPVAVLEEVSRRISPQVHINYGTNETGPLAAAGPALLQRHPNCVGLPVEGVELRIVDEEGRELPRGRVGRIGVRGEEIDASRLFAPAASDAAAFRDGWFYPGDAGVQDEAGVVYFRGRTDELMNFDGQLVAPAEIETVLAAHPGVAEAAAFAVPSSRYQEVPVAALVLRPGQSLAEVSRYAREHLGARAPRKLFAIDALPRNAMGKVERRRLSALVRSKAQPWTE
jgi:long-chain acyl-CoA synthetase